MMMRQYLAQSHLHRASWQLAWPMMLSNLTVPLTGIVDTAVVGHLEHAYFLAATAVGSLVVTSLMWVMGFLRMGTTGLVAQAFGSKDLDETDRLLINAAFSAGLLAVVLLISQSLIWQVALWIIEPSSDVARWGLVYFEIRVWSFPAMLLRFVLIGWFLGMQNARWPLLVLVTTNLVNILLDLALVTWLDFGVAGAAWASVVGDYLGIAIAIVGVFLLRQRQAVEPGISWRIDRVTQSRLFRVNQDIFIRNLALQFVFMMHTAYSASLGEWVLAANALLLNFVMLASFGLDGLAHAAEAMVGKAIGAKSREQYAGTLWVTGCWSLMIAAFMTLLFWVFGEDITGLMTDLEGVKAVAREYLVYLVCLPLVAVGSYWLDGVYVGATEATAMRNSMLLSALLVYWPLLQLTSVLGNHAVWLAFYGFVAMRAITLAASLPKLQMRRFSHS